MSNLSTNTPYLSVPFLDQNGQVSQPWLMFLIQLYQRTGGNNTPQLNLTQVQDQQAYDNTLNFSTDITNLQRQLSEMQDYVFSQNINLALTNGSSILSGNGAGGFSNVTIGANLSFLNGVLSATGGGGTSPASYAFAAAHG